MALTWMAPVSIRHRRKLLAASAVVAATAAGAVAGAALAVGNTMIGGTTGSGPGPNLPAVASVTSLVALNTAVLLGLLLVTGHAHAVARHRGRHVGAGIIGDEALAQAVTVAAPALVRRASTAAAVLVALLFIPSTGVRSLAWAGLTTVALAVVVAAAVVPGLFSAAGDRLDHYEFGSVPARRDPEEASGRIGPASGLLPAAAALVILAVTSGAPAAPSWAAPADALATVTAGGPPAGGETVLAITALAAAGLLTILALAVIAAVTVDRVPAHRHRAFSPRGSARRQAAAGRPLGAPAAPAPTEPTGRATRDSTPA